MPRADHQRAFAGGQRLGTLLRWTVSCGEFRLHLAQDASHVKKDTNIDPLREREDFKKLMAESEKQAAEKK